MEDRIRRAQELLEERARNAPAAPAAAETTELRAKIDELTGDLQRVAADFANYRRRNEAERADFAKFAKTDLITRLLEVLDNFDRALETVPADLRGQPWIEGIWLVERKLRDILASEGLQEIGSVGKPFDPYTHEAIAHVESEEPEGTVVDEVRKAYKLHDRVIRPALVTVAKGTEKNDPSPGRADRGVRTEVEHPGRASGSAASEGGRKERSDA